MKKIISLFQRNYETDKKIRDEIVPGAEWVAAGEGIPTEKIDGTSCLLRGGVLFKRYDAKNGKTPPDGWEPAQDPDPVTGHWPGWIAVGDGPEDRWHREGLKDIRCGNAIFVPPKDGTYELVGPKLQANPHRLPSHALYKHGEAAFTNVSDAPRDFKGLRDYFAVVSVEGIVWHHPDGRMVKIKTRDFGLAWPR